MSTLTPHEIKCAVATWHMRYSMNTAEEITKNVHKDISVHRKASLAYICFIDEPQNSTRHLPHCEPEAGC